MIYKECCPNESDFYAFLSKQNSGIREYVTEYYGLETFEYNGESSNSFNSF